MLLGIVLALLVAGCGAPAPPADLPPPHFGYNEDWIAKPGLLDDAAASGADTERYNVAWSDVEPEPGEWEWSNYDDLYNEALDADQQPLLVLGNAPCWAYGEPAGCSSTPAHPPDAAHAREWAEYAARVAERYPEARGIEVWNEPNLDRFWQGEPLDPGHYASLLTTAYDAIKRVDPRMPVISAGLLPAGEDGPGKLAFAEYLHRVLAISGPGHLDAVGIHPYPFFAEQPAVRVETVVSEVREVLAAAGIADKPIWVTEVGVSTTGPNPYSPDEQALALSDIYDFLAGARGIPVVLIHRFTDIEGDPAIREAGYGVTTVDGDPKPAYCALAQRRGVDPC